MTIMTKPSDLTGDYVLDTAHTRIGFVGRYTMATKVRGQFDEFGGSAHLDGDDPSESSAELTIHAKSIQTRNQQRDEQLRSKFLDTGPARRCCFPWSRAAFARPGRLGAGGVRPGWPRTRAGRSPPGQGPGASTSGRPRRGRPSWRRPARRPWSTRPRS
jgi:hypothetical protein